MSVNGGIDFFDGDTYADMSADTKQSVSPTLLLQFSYFDEVGPIRCPSSNSNANHEDVVVYHYAKISLSQIVISTLSPRGGAVTGGTVVHVSGHGFQATLELACRFAFSAISVTGGSHGLLGSSRASADREADGDRNSFCGSRRFTSSTIVRETPKYMSNRLLPHVYGNN